MSLANITNEISELHNNNVLFGGDLSVELNDKDVACGHLRYTVLLKICI